MRKIFNKGHRIRASDKHLVYHYCIGTLLFVFMAVLLLLNSKQLMRTNWEHFSLLENGLTLSPYNFITIGIATGVCALVAFLYYRFCYDGFKAGHQKRQIFIRRLTGSCGSERMDRQAGETGKCKLDKTAFVHVISFF